MWIHAEFRGFVARVLGSCPLDLQIFVFFVKGGNMSLDLHAGMPHELKSRKLRSRGSRNCRQVCPVICLQGKKATSIEE